MTLLSVIAVDHHSISRLGASEGMESLARQEFRDFEVILTHDGPAPSEWYDWASMIPLGSKQLEVYETGRRRREYGHYSRDLGMRHAHGEWFAHHNIDNVWRPWAFGRIAAEIVANPEADAVVIPVMHHKLGRVLSGNPARENNIDAMQMIARYDVWHDINYWCDHTPSSDGKLYEFIAHKHRVHYIDSEEPFGDNY